MKTYKNSQTMKAHMKRDHGVSQKMINEQKKGGGNVPAVAALKIVNYLIID